MKLKMSKTFENLTNKYKLKSFPEKPMDEWIKRKCSISQEKLK